MLTSEQIFHLAELTKGDAQSVAQLVPQLILTLDMVADQVKDLAARIQKLEAEREPAKTPLRVVNDGP